MKLLLRTFFALCLVAVPPHSSIAQKKSVPSSSAADRQKLADAYDVLISMVTNGAATRSDVDDDDHEILSRDYFKQESVAADRKACFLGWDISVIYERKGYAPEDQTDVDTKGKRYFVPLGKIDIRSMSVKPFTTADQKQQRYSYEYAGFVLTWSYLDWGGLDVPASINPEGKKVSGTRSMILATQEDADRAMKALTYIAKRCGAHETAF